MKKLLLVIAAFGLLLTSCDEENSTNPTKKQYEIPTTYNFDNVDYSGQTARLAMIDAIDAKLKEAITSGANVDSKVIMNMLKNEGNPFTEASLNESGKDIYSKLAISSQDFFNNLVAEMGTTPTNVAAANGVAGIVTSNNGEKKYLVNAKGHDLGELFEKGLMGALMLNQVVGYTSDEKIGDAVDNIKVIEGKGTAKQHHWDEAYGYFGATLEFPVVTDNLQYVAKYCNSRNATTGYNNKIMNNGYLKGRAAINNDDDDAKWEAVKEVRKHWELIFVTTAIHYLNAAKTNFTDDALRTHQLSECWGFLWSIQFNPEKNGNYYQEALDKMGDNFWTITIADINEAIDILANGYELQDIKDEL